MILLHILVFFGLLLPTISPQESLSPASARLNEARARALANRARIRAQAQRIRERINHPPSPRHKRQHIVLDDSDAVVGEPTQDFIQEPHLLHVCPLGEEEEYESFPRSSKDHGFESFGRRRKENIQFNPRINEETLFPRENEEDSRVGGIPRTSEDHDFESFGRKRKENIHFNPRINEETLFPRENEENSRVGGIPRISEDSAVARSNEDIQLQPRILDILKPSVIVSPLPETSRLTVQEAQMEESLDEAIEQLEEAKNKLKRIEEEGFREAGQNQIVIPISHQSQQNEYSVTPADIIQNHQLRGSNADPHLHSYSPLHLLRPFIPQTHVSVPGFHLNHQHGIAQNTPLINQGISPITGPQISPSTGILNTHGTHLLPSHGIFPTQNSFLPTIPQTQSTILKSKDETSQDQSSLFLNDENRKSRVHGLGPFVPHTHVSVPGFHLNQHQGIAHNTPLINQGVLPITGPQILPSTGILNPHGIHHLPSHGIFPGQHSLFHTIPQQTQSTFLRSADDTSKDRQSLIILNDENGKSKAIREGENDDENFVMSAKARESTFDPFNQVDEVMDFLDKHKFRQTVPHHYSPENREADPTIHKLKQLKMLKNQKLQPNFYSPYQNPNYYAHGNLYRESEDSEETLEEERKADPTIHKLKKLKMLKEQKLQPNFYSGYQNPSYYGHGSYYRETEEIIPEEVSQEVSEDQLEEEREADPTIHKLKKLKMLKQQKLMPQYYPSYQKPNYYYREAQDMDGVSSPSLFNFPSNRNRFFQYKRSLQNESDQDPNLVIANISDKAITDAEERKNRSTRSIPLMRLISDPNVRLDVPKTIENFGTVTKNAFEDERAPMYHFKHLVGSSKNALLSAMRIPPQNMIIPSDYEIVKSNDRVGFVNENEDDDPMGFSKTFKRVGHMVRESVKSGQETATHLGDIAHSARNILNSARHAAPRLIIPYSQIPAIHDPRRRTPSKAVLITPRIVDLAQERLGKKQSDQNPNLLKLGQLMEAVGISPSSSKQLDLHKIIFEPRRLHQAKPDQRLAKLYNRFRNNFEDDKDTVMSEALSALEDAKISVGARNLRDFLVKMRNELTSMVRNSPNENKKIHKSKKKKEKEAKEMGRFIENLFDGSEEEKNETVGAGLYLSPELMQPFMGRASQTQLKDFHDENGDGVTRGKNPSPSDHYHHDSAHGDQHNDSKLGYVLGAINPLMLERMYNQTVAVDNNKVEDPESLFGGRLQEARSEESPEGKLGTAMVLTGPMLKPFMGQAQPQAVENFLETYNGDENENINELEE